MTIISKSCFRQNTHLKVADIVQFDLMNARTFKDLWNEIQGLSFKHLSCFQVLSRP